ncbi:related to Assembly factor cbp-4 [Cephalotrichum gorgonifer]|uniref:Cytochrome b mRNA-processing protein 4 n=1 Tax=Cephalotrichum gorgonifer TaxID=2041049 RepID=A0AAE8ST64_9PEZI|nr:related to Assembly factor cbp-4 [Cephalotrichum gorgonifer]
MAPKPTNYWLWAKMLAGGGLIAVGGPYLTMKLTPTEEELFKKYNPELQARSLANRGKKEQEFEDFVTNMKEAAKSDKHIWISLKEMEDRKKSAALAQNRKDAEDEKERQKQMRLDAGLQPTA